MRLAELHLDDMIAVPQGRDVGGGQSRQTERASSFQAAEGWDIRETLPGTFTLYREGMSEPVTVGGYGYSYTRLPELPEPEPMPEPRKGKRR